MISYYFKLRTAYRLDNLFFATGQFLAVFGTILIWSLASGKSIFDSSFSDKLTYFVIGSIFTSMIYQWPSFYGYMIQKGQATADFLRPQNLFMMLFCRYFGIAIYQNLMVLILILFSSPFWISNIQVANFSNTLFFIMCIPSAVIIQFFTELLVGMLAFFITEINGFTLNYGFLYSMFTGKMFPLSLIISVFSINLLNPYSYLFYHPMQIYLGKYTTNEIIYVFLGGLAWCVILAALAQGVFKAGLKRNESVGL